MDKIILDGLKKSYEYPVLTGFSAVMEAGKIYAVMGPSGSGKTTLLRLIAGLETPDSGSITGLEGKRVSFMFQEDRLLENLDAVRNILFVVPEYSRQQILVFLAALGIRQEDAVRPVSEYSGGMKRRVAFLRSVLYASELLLLDEPFKGLDEETADLAVAFLSAHQHGRTIILTTHNVAEAEKCKAEIIRVGFESETEQASGPA